MTGRSARRAVAEGLGAVPASAVAVVLSGDGGTIADLTAAAGLAMAAGDEKVGASLRVELACLVDADSAVPGAEPAGAAAVADVLVAYEEARRVRAERDRQARACRPLGENIMAELAHRGPSTAAELAAATHDRNERVRSGLRRLTRVGLVQPAPPGQGRAGHHELSRAGVAVLMAG